MLSALTIPLLIYYTHVAGEPDHSVCVYVYVYICLYIFMYMYIIVYVLPFYNIYHILGYLCGGIGICMVHSMCVRVFVHVGHAKVIVSARAPLSYDVWLRHKGVG